MRKNHPCPLTKLASDSNFRKLKERADQLSALDRVLQSVLEQHQIKHCKIANFRTGTLFLAVSSAVWLTKFNQKRSDILSDLRQSIPALVSIEAKINPELAKKVTVKVNEPVQFKANPRRISETSAGYILSAAEHASGKLKEKLERLAALATERRASTDNDN
ncbi:DciA family protein [Motilimonas sp. E26]|uniref:DUF721 domain-containing protein n=1 Tax=Motilimonas sp. E26 TaxID=2865674 RepID=UPI001E64D11F|nr:DciA family protein [Motilimonas sp. E26]MCE0555739.1 DciA family protein [Motilimonas sp. E26]